MSTETEIERLVVRLVGNNSDYKRMLKDSEDAAKNAASAVEAEVARIVAGGDLTQTMLHLHEFSQALDERTMRLGKSAESLGREMMAAGGATENELKMLDALVANEKVLRRQEEAFSRKELYVRRASGAVNQYVQQVDDLRILLDKGAISQDQFNENIRQLDASLPDNQRLRAVAEAVDLVTTSYRKQAETAGMNRGEVQVYDLKQLGASPAQVQQVVKVQGQAEAAEAAARMQSRTEDLTKSLSQQMQVMDVTSAATDRYRTAFSGLVTEQDRSQQVQAAVNDAVARYKLAQDGANLTQLKDVEYAQEQARARQLNLTLMERGQRLTDSLKTSGQQYNERLADLNQLLNTTDAATGKAAITQETYNKAMKQMHSEHLVQTAQGLADVSGKIALFTGLLSFGAAGIREMGIKSAAAYEETEVAFGTMMGSAEKAKSFLSELTAFAVKTPFEMPELENVSRQLIMFGETQQSVMETTEMLGNVAAGVGRQHFNMLGIIYNQIRGVGHLLTGDFRQMATRGAVSLQDIAKYYKVADSAAMQMISHGKVSFEDFRNIMMTTTKEGGRFAGMMEKQSGTMGGLMSTYSDAQGIAMRKIAENFLPAEKAWLRFKIFFMDSIANMNGPTAALVSTMVRVGAAAVSVMAGISGTVYAGTKLISTYNSVVSTLTAMAQAEAATTASTAALGTVSAGSKFAIDSMRTSELQATAAGGLLTASNVGTAASNAAVGTSANMASLALKGLTVAKYAAVAAGAALGIATAAVVGYNLGKMWYEATEEAQRYRQALKDISDELAGIARRDIKRMDVGRLDQEAELAKKQLAAQEAILASAKKEGKETEPFEKAVQAQKDYLKSIEDARVLRAPELPIEETEIRAKKAEDEYNRIQKRLTEVRKEAKQLNPQVEEAQSRLKWSLPGEGEQEAKAQFTALFARQKQLREEEAKLSGERTGAISSMQGLQEARKKAREEAGMEIDPQKVQKSVEQVKEQIKSQKLKVATELMPPKEAELYKLADSLKMKDTTIGLKGIDVKVEEEKLRLYNERKEQLDEEWAKKERKIETDRANAAHKLAEKYEDQAKNAGKTKYELEEIKLRAERIKDVTGQSELPKYTDAEISRITAGMKAADLSQSNRTFKDRTDDFIKQAWAVGKTSAEVAVYEENLKRTKAGLNQLTQAQEESFTTAMAMAETMKAKENLKSPLEKRRDQQAGWERMGPDYARTMADAQMKAAREQLDPNVKLRQEIENQLDLLKDQPALLQRQLDLWAGFKDPIQDAADKSRTFREEMEKAGKASEWVATLDKSWRQQLDPLKELKAQVADIGQKFKDTGDVKARDEAFRQMNRSVTDSIDPTAKYADETSKLDYMLKETGLSQKDYDLKMREAKKGLGQLTEAELEQIKAQTQRMDGIRANTDAMRQMQQYTLEFLAQNTKAAEQMLAADQLRQKQRELDKNPKPNEQLNPPERGPKPEAPLRSKSSKLKRGLLGEPIVNQNRALQPKQKLSVKRQVAEQKRRAYEERQAKLRQAEAKKLAARGLMPKPGMRRDLSESMQAKAKGARSINDIIVADARAAAEDQIMKKMALLSNPEGMYRGENTLEAEEERIKEEADRQRRLADDKASPEEQVRRELLSPKELQKEEDVRSTDQEAQDSFIRALANTANTYNDSPLQPFVEDLRSIFEKLNIFAVNSDSSLSST